MKHLDHKSKKMLEAIKRYGEATTTQIRYITGLSNNDITYRYSKLSKLNLIDVEKSQQTRGGKRVNKAVLTPKGEDIDIDGEIPEPIHPDVESRFTHIEEQLDQLTSRLNAITNAKMNTDTDDRGRGQENIIKSDESNEIDQLQQNMYHHVRPYIYGLRRSLEAEFDINVEEYINEYE